MYDTITITLEEYKELLIIKGKYEELKNKDKSWISRDMFVGVTDEHLKRCDEFRKMRGIEPTCEIGEEMQAV